MSFLQESLEILEFLLAFVSLAVWYDVVQRWLTKRELPLAYRPRVPVPWNPVAVVAIVFLFWALVPTLAMQFLGVPLEPKPHILTLRAVQANCLAQFGLCLLIPGALAMTSRSSWADFGLPPQNWREDLYDLWAGIWGFIACLAPVFLAALAVQNWREDHPHELLRFLKTRPDLEAVAWAGLSAVILAPLSEEMIFRVVLQGTLENYMRAEWAIVIVASAFAAMHQGVDRIPIFPLALIMGYVYHRRRSLLAAAVFHALFNGSNLLMALASGK